MSIPFFDSILHAVGKRINYDAVVNYAGNSFAKDSWTLIQDANPLIKPKSSNSKFANMIGGQLKMKTVKSENDMGISWINDVQPTNKE